VEKNFKLTLEYDGSNYHGWQRQTDDLTIQETIEAAVEKMTGKPAKLIGSGRTDAGVHALGQVANFHCNTSLTPDVFQRGLNSLLPEDIVITSCTSIAHDFHARYSAVAKTYAYRILNRKLPRAVGRRYAWWIKKPLDKEAMASAVSYLIGSNDYKAFEAVGSPRRDTIRQVTDATLEDACDGVLVFSISADGFLRYMVRNIVGTLVEVGIGKRRPEDMKRILGSRDRSLAGPTAPAHGLFLVAVDY